jgi:hypothetical protein
VEDFPPLKILEAVMNRKVLGALVGLAGVVILISLAFVLPLKHSGAHDLPVGITGPATATSQLSATLSAQAPGDYDLTDYESIDDLRSAIENREVVGGIAITPTGPTVLVASAGGAQIAQTLRGVATALSSQAGTQVPVEDVVPTTSSDPQAAGITGLALPLVLGGMVPAIVFVRLLAGKPLNQAAAVVIFAILVGFALAAVLRFGVGTFSENYVIVALGIALGMSAISLTLVGLAGMFGLPGLGVGAVIMMLVGNPLSGITSTAYWLPSGWAEFGQLLPPGASGTLLRSSAFFDGHGGGEALIVLLCWAAVGVGLTLFAWKRSKPSDVGVPTPDTEPVAVS